MTSIKLGLPTASRIAVSGAEGAIASGHPVSTEVGLRVLAEGGNAVDAVIAAAFAAFVVEPGQCGVGGHGRMSVHLAGRDLSVGIDHFIRAPAAATPEMYQAALAGQRRLRHAAADDAINMTGHLAVGVPGAVAGLCEAHRLFATRPLAALAAPAIDLAQSGVPLDWRTTLQIVGRAAEIRDLPEAAARLLPNGLPPRPANWLASGDRLDQGDLSRTLRAIAEHGPAGFYDGPVGAAIARDMARHGGLLTLDDLRACRPDVFIQPTHRYRAHRYVTCGDLISVEALNILDQFDLASLEPEQAEIRHLMIEALAQAFLDNLAYAGDPRDQDSPQDGLASAAYARKLADRIAPNRAASPRRPGDPWPEHQAITAAGQSGGARPFEGTTQICAADREGNVAALITSLGSAFGSLVHVPETGVFLGNGMQWFNPKPGHSNSVGPGRMPLYAAPVLIAFDARGACGAIVGSGGYRITTAVLHPLVALIDHGKAAQSALDWPRIHTEGGGVVADRRIDQSVIDELSEMGHKVELLDPLALLGGFGRASAVWRAPGGEWEAAAEAWSGGAGVLVS